MSDGIEELLLAADLSCLCKRPKLVRQEPIGQVHRQQKDHSGPCNWAVRHCMRFLLRLAVNAVQSIKGVTRPASVPWGSGSHTSYLRTLCNVARFSTGRPCKMVLYSSQDATEMTSAGTRCLVVVWSRNNDLNLPIARQWAARRRLLIWLLVFTADQTTLQDP